MSVEPWTLPQLWRGMTCFVLGSGPSIRSAGVDRLRGAKVIAVNCAMRLAPFADVLFFNDLQWFVRFRPEVEAFGGMIVTTSLKAAEAMPHRIRMVSAEHSNGFPPAGSPFIREGTSSGQRAIALSVGLGAFRIPLVGFDMREVDGETHFHSEYRNDPSRYREHFIPSFAGWHRDARARGVSIVNATEGSALKEFPMSSIDAELPGLAA